MSSPMESACQDRVKLEFPSLTQNIGFARSAAAVYASRLDYTIDEINDIRTAVSEAVSNAVIHAYPDSLGMIVMEMGIQDGHLWIKVSDTGQGIADVAWAVEPAHTTLPDEHMGLGLFFISESMDDVQIESVPQVGTTIVMKKRVSETRKGATSTAVGSC